MSDLLVEPDILSKFRADLTAARFFVTQVNELLGERASAALLRDSRVPALLVARSQDSDLAILARLFVLWDIVWDIVEAEAVSRALPSVEVSDLVRLGLVESDGEKVRALVQLQPHAAAIKGREYNWWIASDLGEGLTGQAVGRDHVLGIGGATRTSSR